MVKYVYEERCEKPRSLWKKGTSVYGDPESQSEGWAGCVPLSGGHQSEGWAGYMPLSGGSLGGAPVSTVESKWPNSHWLPLSGFLTLGFIRIQRQDLQLIQ